MTREEIIEMANDAELGHEIWIDNDDEVLDTLVKFAQLVAAAEREACAKICDELDKAHWGCEIKGTWCSEAIRARGQQ